ncbi:hypothetical protein AB0K11_27215 [Mycobacterium sp. NPDC050551]|uniref:hypothetical protein n=1 Tax=Mycobacterium sp. NPDC050551 TaxID=3155407 RepID=UPI00342F0255
MPSFRRKASTDAGSGPVTGPPTDEVSPADPQDRPDPALAGILAEEAEAEAAEAEAAAAAARARARALRLRRQAQEAEVSAAAAAATVAETEPVAADSVQDDEPVADTPAGDPDTETVDADDVADESVADEAGADDGSPVADFAAHDADEKPARRRLHLRVPLPTWKGVALFLAVLCTGALLAASGYMIREHRQAERDAQLTAEYTAAGRQAVVTLMSLDFNKAEEGVQRIIDNSTGKFREDFQQQAQTFAQVAQDSKVITEVTVNSAAVSTMTDDSANVIVSATSRVTNAAGANKDPRGWRLSVDLERDGDQVKMSRVEFVP